MAVADDPVSDGADGRDARTGRFAAGNKYGKGNPRMVQLARLRDQLRSAATTRRVRAILDGLLADAETGDQQARRLVLEYVIGRPREQAPEVAIALPDLSTAAGIAEAHRAIVAAAAAGEVRPDDAERIAGLVQRAADASVLADLEARLAALEARP